MRLAVLSSCLVTVLLPTVTGLSLLNFQPINGFSPQCTQAYETPLSGCSHSDFQDRGCSLSCINFLEALTKMLNTECKGTSAFPNTLIGLFFSQQGTSTLCPNVLGTSGGESGSSPSYTPAAAESTTEAAAAPSTTEAPSSKQDHPTAAESTTEVSSSMPSSPSPSSSSSTSSPHSTAPTASLAEATSSSARVKSVSSSSASISQTPLPPPPPPATPAVPTSATSPSSSPSSPTLNANADTGGQGTILDIGSSAPPNARASSAAWAWILGAWVLFVCSR